MFALFNLTRSINSKHYHLFHIFFSSTYITCSDNDSDRVISGFAKWVGLAFLTKFAFPNGNNINSFLKPCRKNIFPKGWVILHWAGASFTHPLRDENEFVLLSTEFVQKIGPRLRDQHFLPSLYGKLKPKNIFLSAETFMGVSSGPPDRMESWILALVFSNIFICGDGQR